MENKKVGDYKGQVIGEYRVVHQIGFIEVPRYKKGERKFQKYSLWKVRCSCGSESQKTSKELGRLKRGTIKTQHCSHPSHKWNLKKGDRAGDIEFIDYVKNEGQSIGNKRKSGNNFSDSYFLATKCLLCDKWNKENPFIIQYYTGWICRLNRREKNPNCASNCGCVNPSYRHGHARRDGMSIEYILLRSAKKRAAIGGYPFNLEIEDIVIPERCPVLGIPLRKEKTTSREIKDEDAPSLDKFVPMLGYVKGNVQVISWRANRLKNDGRPQDWLKIAKWCQKEENVKRIKDLHTSHEVAFLHSKSP